MPATIDPFPTAESATSAADPLHAGLKVLYRRRWLTAGVLACGLVVASVYLATSTSVFEARAQLVIQPDNPNVVSFKEVLDQDGSAADYYQTQYTMLQSRTLARMVIDTLNLWTYPELAGTVPSRFPWLTRLLERVSASVSASRATAGPAGPPADQAVAEAVAIDRFLARLTIEPVKNSRIVNIRFRAMDPRVAARVANTLAESYIDQTLNVRVQAAKDAVRWLEERTVDQRRQVEASEEALQRYREQNDASALEDKQNVVVQKLTELSAAATRARTVRIERQTLLEQLQAARASNVPLDTLSSLGGNGLIQQLKSQLADLQRQEAQLEERLGDRHPEMLKVRSAIHSVELKLQTELDKATETIKNDYAAARALEQRLQAEFDSQKAQALQLDRKAIDYGVLQRNAASDRQVFEALLQRTKEIGISGEIKSGNVRIVDQADVPRRPVWPDRTRILMAALAASACLALVAAFGAERLDRRFLTPDHVEQQLGLTSLGFIPQVRMRRRDGEPLIVKEVPANFVEAFGSLRASVLFGAKREPTKLILVTSAKPLDGKTVVASNLAIALAQMGARVALIDIDLRRPKVHKTFDLPVAPGLADIVADGLRPSLVFHHTPVTNLSILTAGVHHGDPGVLLGSAPFKTWLDRLGEHFEYIVLDSPPVLAVGDAAMAAAAYDTCGVVFVVSAATTRRDAAKVAVERLGAVGARFIGVVLNRLNVAGHPHYYDPYYHRDYQSYWVQPGRRPRKRAHVAS